MAQTNAQKQAAAEKAATTGIDVDALKEQLRSELMAELTADFKETVLSTATTAGAQAKPEKIINDDPNTEGSVTVHFVDDGFTGLGKIWYRGEELTVSPGSDNWKQLTDAGIGRMVLELNEAEQAKRWGRRLFAPGPWPFAREFDLDKTAYMTKVGDQMVFDQVGYEQDKAKLATIQKAQAQVG